MTGHNVFRDPQGFPPNKGPVGHAHGDRPRAGELRWQVRSAPIPSSRRAACPPTGTFNIGGPLVTAGGLVFIGAAMDERFHAFDAGDREAARGSSRWTPAATRARLPSRPDGRQFVVIAAGGGGKPETRPGSAYYCFALPRAGSSGPIARSLAGDSAPALEYDERPGARMTKGRLEAFSDGVVAIIITIMVLELKVPHGEDLQALRPARARLPELRAELPLRGHLLEQPPPPAARRAPRERADPVDQPAPALFWLSLFPFANHWIGETGLRRHAVAPTAACC
jgi:hypothetical protein